MDFDRTLDDIRPADAGDLSALRRRTALDEHRRAALLTGVAAGGATIAASGSILLGVAVGVGVTVAFARWLVRQASGAR